MEILYLGGFKQTVYFDTGRLQGYPLCEIDFFLFLIGFSIIQLEIDQLRCEKVYPRNWLPQKIGYPKKLIKKKWLPPKKMLPKKIDQKKNGYPPKKCYPKKMIKQKLATQKKFGVLYCEVVYYWILEKWRTLFCTSLFMRFKHYTHTHIYIYIYIHTCVCVCVCGLIWNYKPSRQYRGIAYMAGTANGKLLQLGIVYDCVYHSTEMRTCGWFEGFEI